MPSTASGWGVAGGSGRRLRCLAAAGSALGGTLRAGGRKEASGRNSLCCPKRAGARRASTAESERPGEAFEPARSRSLTPPGSVAGGRHFATTRLRAIPVAHATGSHVVFGFADVPGSLVPGDAGPCLRFAQRALRGSVDDPQAIAGQPVPARLRLAVPSPPLLPLDPVLVHCMVRRGAVRCRRSVTLHNSHSNS